MTSSSDVTSSRDTSRLRISVPTSSVQNSRTRRFARELARGTYQNAPPRLRLSQDQTNRIRDAAAMQLATMIVSEHKEMQTLSNQNQNIQNADVLQLAARRIHEPPREIVNPPRTQLRGQMNASETHLNPSEISLQKTANEAARRAILLVPPLAMGRAEQPPHIPRTEARTDLPRHVAGRRENKWNFSKSEFHP